MKNKKERRNRGEPSRYRPVSTGKKIISAFREPLEPVLEPQIQLSGNRTIYIEGCRGILEFDDCYLKISLGKKTLTVVGAELTVEGYEGHNVTICGRIQGLEFV